MPFPYEEKQFEILVKQQAKSELGKPPAERTIAELLEGAIVNIDKPAGPTSHQVSDFTKQILKSKKAGHSGTLDPGVTGVLVIAYGKATRIVQALLIAGKEYIAVMHIHAPKEEQEIREMFAKYVGTIDQLPPKKSAVKRAWRKRTVYYAEILEIDGQDVLFRIGTQAGTYIRKYIHDFGQKMGCGAHMQNLRRTRAGPFAEDTLITLQDLTDAIHYHKEGNDEPIKKLLLPIETAVEHLPKVWIHDSAVKPLTHGVDLNVPGVVKLYSTIEPDQMVAIMSLKDELVALGTAQLSAATIMKEEKGLAVEVAKVFYEVKEDIKKVEESKTI